MLIAVEICAPHPNRADLKVGHYKPGNGPLQASSEAHNVPGPLESGRYFLSASPRPTFRLSKLSSVFSTREYVFSVSPR